MYDDRYNWKMTETDHFIYMYTKGSEAEKDIDLIMKNRESAYNFLVNYLGIKIDCKFKLYFTPNKNFCYTRKMVAQAAIPHKKIASLIYSQFPFCEEKMAFGHEIVHLLIYNWDNKKYHLECLEEGIAKYLDFSGTNKHLDYLKKISFSFGINSIDLSLRVSHMHLNTDYEKAGSLVKFLIENYGLQKFKELYLCSSIEKKGHSFILNNKQIAEDFLIKLLEKVYSKRYIELQKEWLNNIGLNL